MDYENGEKKYSKERKHSSHNDYKDDYDYYYKVAKQKYKDKERDHRDRDRDYKYKERRDKERDYKDRETKDRIRERYRDKDKFYKYRDRDGKDRNKRHRSRDRSISPLSHKRDRSRSRSGSHYRSRSRSKCHSRSRSRSRHRSGSRHRSHSRQLPSSLPHSRKHYDDKRYDSSYSRGKEISEPPFSHNKGQRKMMILEKLGIDLVVPDKSQTGNVQTATGTGQKSVTVTGELAAYCNITPANSKMILDRLNRKKLLWTNKANEQKTSVEVKEGASAAAAAGSKSNTVWQSAIFSKDGDNKQTAKFKRLMGIKDDEASESKPDTSTSGDNKDLIKRQEEMFQNMEMQYEVARASTHTHRGIGLGFGIHQYPR